METVDSRTIIIHVLPRASLSQRVVCFGAGPSLARAGFDEAHVHVAFGVAAVLLFAFRDRPFPLTVT
jgi:hypothetical protein